MEVIRPQAIINNEYTYPCALSRVKEIFADCPCCIWFKRKYEPDTKAPRLVDVHGVIVASAEINLREGIANAHCSINLYQIRKGLFPHSKQHELESVCLPKMKDWCTEQLRHPQNIGRVWCMLIEYTNGNYEVHYASFL